MKQRAPKAGDAAGAVLWRRCPTDSRTVEIALVHRPRYDDWSLPKGKIDRGETPAVTAVREIAEETGLNCRLGRHLRTVDYPIPGHAERKQVDYWAAEVTLGDLAAESVDVDFVPNDEVDVLRWLRPEQAVELLTYPLDHGVVQEFGRLPAQTTTLLLVRHAKAGTREGYRGDDRLRPLDRTGLAQAHALVPTLRAFGVTGVHSADRVRCVETVRPLADALGVELVVEPSLSEQAYPLDPDAAVERIRKIAAHSGVRAVCSQGKVIPGLLDTLAESDGLRLPPSGNRKASFWVLSWHAGVMIAADYVDSPLPAR